jgi:hypothetical protein
MGGREVSLSPVPLESPSIGALGNDVMGLLFFSTACFSGVI